MTFADKSAIAMTAALTVVFGWYAVLLARQPAGAPAEVAWEGLLVAALVALVVLAAAAHAVIAVATPADVDDRDRPGRLRSHQVARAVLAGAVVTGLGLAMVDAATFWIAQVLLAGLVLAEIAAGVTGLLASRSRARHRSPERGAAARAASAQPRRSRTASRSMPSSTRSRPTSNESPKS